MYKHVPLKLKIHKYDIRIMRVEQSVLKISQERYNMPILSLVHQISKTIWRN